MGILKLLLKDLVTLEQRKKALELDKKLCQQKIALLKQIKKRKKSKDSEHLLKQIGLQLQRLRKTAKKQSLQTEYIPLTLCMEIITLNVGGTLFRISSNNLLLEGDTFFTKEGMANKIEGCAENTQFDIDRDPKYFGLILNHLRRVDISREINNLSEVELFSFVQEVKFYEIGSLMRILPFKGKQMLKELRVNFQKYGIIQYYFTKCGINAQLSNDNRRIKKLSPDIYNCGATGAIGCHHFKIKIITPPSNNDGGLMIGFARHVQFYVNMKNYDTGCGWFLSNEGTKYSTKGREVFVNNGINYTAGTIIECIYSPEKETIYFIVNGVCYLVFWDVKDTGDLCPAFDIYHQNTEFEFVEF
ncbi:hypothetical protein ABK040_005164 [Willaertia magna]